MSTQPVPALPAAQRNIAVDAYRGFVMLLMLAEVLHFSDVAQSFPSSLFWRILAFNQSHAEWVGMSLHDMIQPSFTFLVGVALPYSVRSRQKKGETLSYMFGHTLWRSFLLIALGIFLRSIHSPMTNFTFEDTLTQIGLGYTFAFALTLAKPRWQWIGLGSILFLYWLAWALYPLPAAGFDYAQVGVPADWRQHLLTGFSAHWNKNANFGQAFDLWFLNLFPRAQRFLYNGGGYLTISFIPTLGTMLLGLAAGRWFLASAPRLPVKKFLAAAAVLLLVGLALHFTGLCPIVKRIWTPAWTLFSGGMCFLFLAAFTWVIDAKGFRRPAFPLLVIGMNSIAVYLMAWMCEEFFATSFKIHLGSALNVFGAALQPIVLGTLVLATYWLILFSMYRKQLFIRI